MNESYTNISNFSFFSRAQRQLDTMISKLESIGIQEHSVTEEYIRDSGAELLRLLLGHFDKLAHDEGRFASVSTADSFPRNHVRQGTTCTLVSLFGSVTVTRLSYSQRQAIKLTKQVASDFVGFYEQRTVSDEQTGDLLVLSFDGKGVVMRPNGLRECTQKLVMHQSS